MNVAKKKITVLGAARSGLAAARMLVEMGAYVFISDSGSPRDLIKKMKKLKLHNVLFETENHSKMAYHADFAILSPGIPLSSEVVQRMNKEQIPVYSEVEAAYWFNKSSLIAVTGSNGKTTTVTLIGEMLRKKNPDSIVAGNIGEAFSDFVLESKKDHWSVVELSSFQLETIDTFKPDVAVILNFAPNHLDRYDSYDDYIKAKWRITKNIGISELIVYNMDDEKLKSWTDELHLPAVGFSTRFINETGAGLYKDNIYLYGEKLISTKEISLKGVHNYMNVMAAVLAVQRAEISKADMCAVLKGFSGVEHRLEKVSIIRGVTYINDSKATTVESLMYALQSFDKPIVLIAGGKDKGSDFNRLNELISKNVKELVLIGKAAGVMKKCWGELKQVHQAETMEEAVKKAASIAEKDDVVLMSPACASFDMFSNYEERGAKFKQYVQELEKYSGKENVR